MNRHVVDDDRALMDSRNHLSGFVGIDVLPESGTRQDVTDFVNLRGRDHEFDVVPKPGLVELVRWRARRDERADKNVGVKNMLPTF